MSSGSPSWRPLQGDDLSQVNRVADAVHTLYERDAVFAEKFRLYPEGCFTLVRDEAVVGYCISHPWMLMQIPSLDSFLGAMPAILDCLYIHDVAILPEARGQGAARSLVRMLVGIANAHGLAKLSLVSVYGTAPLWARLGFTEVLDDTLSIQLGCYGSSARYMTRDEKEEVDFQPVAG